MIDVAIEMRKISKEFGPVKALDDVDLVVKKGSIHGVVGANGAGKSTIIKILAGIYSRDTGSVFVDGQSLGAITPASIEKEGVHFIHQDRLLVPTASVAEAIFLNNEPLIGPFLNIQRMKREATKLVKEYFSINLNPNTLVRDLSAAQQKIVQITRALANNAKVLVLDEPTAALVSAETTRLFQVLRELQRHGIAIIFISHYIQEIMDLCDEVTILRNGRNAGHLQIPDTSVEGIVSLMVDRKASEMYPQRNVKIGSPLLELTKLTRNGYFENVDMSLHSGEVLGVIGLLGSGDKQLLKCMFGLDQADSGSMKLNGKEVRFGAPSQAVESGIAMIPEDRRAHGVATDLTISENISVASINQYAKRGMVDTLSEAEWVDHLIEELGIKTPTRFLPAKNLSGGNQQKVVVAKWLGCDSLVYLLDDPTVAVDVGAKVEIYNLINRLSSEGKGLIFVSSDIQEVLEMCDRILVMYKGAIVGAFNKGEANGDTLLAIASGASSERKDAS